MNARPAAARFRRPVAWALSASLLAGVAGPAGAAPARRCSKEQQLNVCLDAKGTCPAVAGPLGPAASEWPMFQHDAQHTGKSPFRGPGCPNLLWSGRIRGPILSQPAIGDPAPGATDGILYVATAKYPVCALEPSTGAKLWCATDNRGKLPDRSAPALGNGDYIYVGTRDNDFWAMTLPSAPGTYPDVRWRQKVCTDGDISTSTVITDGGMTFMGSDSLGAGTIMAMCPGPDQQIRWCVNPVGDGVKNVSPATSPDGTRVYFLAGGRDMISYDVATGEEKWRIRLEDRRNGLRGPNFSPVVNPATGRIYFGGDVGIHGVDVVPNGAAEQPVATIFASPEPGERLLSPPALDVANDRMIFGAMRVPNAYMYAVRLSTGERLWRVEIGRTKFSNVPPVIDVDGNVYFVGWRSIASLAPDGSLRWKLPVGDDFQAGPILGRDRLYAGTRNGLLFAVGGCS